ncbi:hypothetical protein CKQ90_34655, partial [Klebsiella pneumoniae]
RSPASPPCCCIPAISWRRRGCSSTSSARGRRSICGLWFSGLLTLIPLASLAAVLLYTGYKLATPRLFIDQFRQGAAQ